MDFKTLRGSKSPLFWRIIEFLRSKKFARKILSPLKCTKIVLLIAFQQSLNSGQKTTDFHRYLQILVKNRCRFTAGDLKAFFLFFCFDFFHNDPGNNFCFCKFFAKGLKSEGERLLVKFWTITAVAVATAFRVLQRWKKQCNQISNGCLEKFKKN